MDDGSEEPKIRITWVQQIRNPDAPTAAELAGGIPLGDSGDEGLQFAKADDVLPLLLPRVDRYLVINNPDGSKNILRQVTDSQGLEGEPDWIVFRPADDVPADALPRGIDGWWLDRRGLPAGGTLVHQSGFVGQYAPTGRFETREDGAVAEVFEVRP